MAVREDRRSILKRHSRSHQSTSNAGKLGILGIPGFWGSWTRCQGCIELWMRSCHCCQGRYTVPMLRIKGQEWRVKNQGGSYLRRAQTHRGLCFPHCRVNDTYSWRKRGFVGSGGAVGNVWASVQPDLHLPYIIGWRLYPMRRRVVADL